MVKFADSFPDERIVAILGQQLSWSHFRLLLPVADPLKRDFYAEMCRLEPCSGRTLQKKINGMLFERTAQTPGHLRLDPASSAQGRGTRRQGGTGQRRFGGICGHLAGDALVSVALRPGPPRVIEAWSRHQQTPRRLVIANTGRDGLSFA